jgi:hypothetical protein
MKFWSIFKKIPLLLMVLISLNLGTVFAQATSSTVGWHGPYLSAKGIYWGDNLDMHLPQADGSTGQVLVTNGSGTVSWGAGASVSGDTIFGSTDSLVVGVLIADSLDEVWSTLDSKVDTARLKTDSTYFQAVFVDTAEVKAKVDTTRLKADSIYFHAIFVDTTEIKSYADTSRFKADSIAQWISINAKPDTSKIKAGPFMKVETYGNLDSMLISCLVDTAGNTNPATVADMIEDSLNANMRPQSQGWAGDSAHVIAPEVVEDSLVEVRTLIQDMVEDSLVEARALIYTVVSDTSATMRTYAQDVIEDSLVEVRSLVYTVSTDTAASLRAYAETVAGDSATVHGNDALAYARDTIGVVITDSSLVDRAELNDSIAAIEGRVLTASAINDSIARLEADIRDTVLVVVGGFVVDSLAALRQEMKDSSAVVIGDSLSANYLPASTSRGEMSDTSLAHANLVRGELRDSTTTVWNDSAIVIIRMAEFVDSLTALEERIAADSLAVLRAEMPDSAARVVADSATVMRTYAQNVVEDSLVEVRTYAETVAGDSAWAVSAKVVEDSLAEVRTLIQDVVEDSLVEVRAQIYTVVSDTATTMRTYVQNTVEDSLVEVRTEIASKLDTSDVAVAGGVTKGWNGTTLTITAASNSGISDSLARADSTHNRRWIAALSTDSTWSGTTYMGIAGETLTWRQALYMKSDGKLYKAKADTLITMPVIGLSLCGAAANGAVLVLEEGFVCDTAFILTPGKRIYPSAATAGAIDSTVVSTAAHVSQILGVGWSENVLKFKPSLVEAVK